MSVLITGGTGSFGHAMAKTLLDQGCERVVILSRDEVKQDAMRQTFNDPRLRFFLGDVRDLDRLKMAMSGVQTVYHAAALKRVPQCEYDPEEAVKTNILGSMNVCAAAMSEGVECVVALSTDKSCLDYHTLVPTIEGPIPIHQIVSQRLRTKVWSFDGTTFGWREITDWHKTPLGGRQMYRLSYEHQHTNRQAGPNRLLLTEDHPVLTLNGWREAQHISSGDLIATGEYAPNPAQMETLIGTVLGDASLTKPNLGGRSSVAFGHCEEQAEWLDVKCLALGPLGVKRKTFVRAGRGRQAFLRASSPTLAALAGLRTAFYPEGLKVIPRELVESHFGPRLLAAWFLDDGCCSDGTLRIATHGFTQADVEWAATFLTSRGYSAKAYRWRSGYCELRLGVEAAKAVCRDIGAFVPPSLRYKLPHPAPAYDPALWDTGAAAPHFARAIIAPEKRYKTKDVYCLGVEGTHNFLANGIVVHNCSPTNLYGATKLCVEKIVTNYNAYTQDTRYMCVRYGNVAGSRGSVIPLWREVIGNGSYPRITDPGMTRFWITLGEAVALAQRAAEEGKGGEVFIPHLPAYELSNLLKAISAEFGCAGIAGQDGLRPGEKMHESMLSADELHLARDYGTHLCLHPTHAWKPQRTDGVPVSIPLTSDTAPRLSVAELQERLKDV